MSRVAFFRYATSALELSVIALAALGLNDLARVPEHRRRLAWAAAAVLVVTAAAALAVWPFVRSLGPGFHHGAYFGASVAWGASVGVVAAGLALLRNARVRVSLLAALVAADALALFVLPELSAPRADTVDLAPAAYLHLHLGESRFFTLGPIQPNYGSYFELAELNLNDFAPKTYARYVHTRLDPVVNPGLFVGNLGGWRPARAPSPAQELSRHLSGYRAAAVRYVLAPAGQPLPRGPHGFHLVLRTPTTWIYQLAGSSAYFGAPGCQIHSSGRQRAAVSCLQPVTLVRRETWFPGWSARVDGRPAPIRRVDGLFQGVAVPAGSHRVTFSFTPPGIGWAGLAALAGCALMCAPALARRRADRGPAPRAAG